MTALCSHVRLCCLLNLQTDEVSPPVVSILMFDVRLSIPGKSLCAAELFVASSYSVDPFTRSRFMYHFLVYETFNSGQLQYLKSVETVLCPKARAGND